MVNFTYYPCHCLTLGTCLPCLYVKPDPTLMVRTSVITRQDGFYSEENMIEKNKTKKKWITRRVYVVRETIERILKSPPPVKFLMRFWVGPRRLQIKMRVFRRYTNI